MARVKDYVDTQDFTKEEILDMINLGLLVKENLYLNMPGLALFVDLGRGKFYL